MNKQSSFKKYHTSVMLNEAVDALNIETDKVKFPTAQRVYIDATMGEAGHSLEILSRLRRGDRLISIDQDAEAIEFVKTKFHEDFIKSPKSKEVQWDIVQSNFSELQAVVEKLQDFNVAGVLFDLGLSSRQLDLTDRGFSFRQEAQPLDMRMDTQLAVKATDFINALNEKQLAKLIRMYGEERNANKIAHAIKRMGVIDSVAKLNRAIKEAMPMASVAQLTKSKSRVYQALRIAVNSELEILPQALTSAFELLQNHGRLVVISFHSLEDRIVKNTFRQLVQDEQAIEIGEQPTLPSASEVEANPRSRSAKMRVIEKIRK